VKIGNFYYQDKDYKRAIAEYQQLINQYPNTSAASFALYNIGKCYIALGSYRNAIGAFERLSPESDLAPAAGYEIGYAWYDEKNPGRNLGNAVRALMQVPQKYPKSPDATRALLLAGRCYEELVEWSKAADTYRQIITNYPTSKQAEVAQLLLGHALRGQEEYSQAVEAYDVIRKGGTERFPVDIVIDATLYKAQTQYLMGQYFEAGKTYLRVPTLYKRHNPLKALHAIIRAAAAFDKAGKVVLAKDEYRNAVEFYELNISTVQDAKVKKEWDALYDNAQKKLLQLLEKIKQE